MHKSLSQKMNQNKVLRPQIEYKSREEAVAYTYLSQTIVTLCNF